LKIENRLRDYQDNIRDAGWRIKWIPWQKPGRPEYVYNTPLTFFTGFGGAGLFIGAIIWLLVFRDAQGPALTVAIAGIVVIISGRVYAAINKQSGWVCIDARCIDREIKQCISPSEGNVNYVWEMRVLCKLIMNDREYKVTLEASHVTSFGSIDTAEEYLNDRIQFDGTCRLWVDPRNPLHAVFDKKQWI
jgi:hypothetical protein